MDRYLSKRHEHWVYERVEDGWAYLEASSKWCCRMAKAKTHVQLAYAFYEGRRNIEKALRSFTPIPVEDCFVTRTMGYNKTEVLDFVRDCNNQLNVTLGSWKMEDRS